MCPSVHGDAGDTVTARSECLWPTSEGAFLTGRCICPGGERPRAGTRPAFRGVASRQDRAGRTDARAGLRGGRPARWVSADVVLRSLSSHAFGRGWRSGRRAYAVMVPKTNTVTLGGRKKKIEQLVERLREEVFSEVSPPADSAGQGRPWEWACVGLAAGSRSRGMSRWLWFAGAPTIPKRWASTRPTAQGRRSVEELVRVCRDRWAVEEAFAQAKGEVGWTTTR